MPKQPCIRLPLQTGGGALGALFWTALTTFAAFGAASFGLFILFSTNREGESTGGLLMMSLIPALCSLGFGAATFAIRREYVKQRATDVEVDGRELRFVGGALGGTAIPWDEIESCTITTDSTRYVRTKTIRRTTTEYVDQLWLARRRSSPQLLAESLDPGEKASLEELRQAILGACQARGGRAGEDGATAPPTSVLQCAACGSAVAAVEATETSCGSCGASVEFDPDTTERIRSAADLGRVTERLEEAIRRLLDQPPATSANRPLDLLGILILAVPAAALGVFVLPGGGAMRGLALLAVGVPFATGIAFLARLFVAERQALRALTAGMGARNPARAGEPPRCRQCGGTLLIRDRHVVAICLFCRAENLLGLDLRPALAAAQSHNYELGAILAKRHSQRRRAVAGLVACAVVTALALLAVIA